MRQDILDKLHATQVEMLEVVDKFCKKHGLKYYLIAGTLLGAVRHHGFIPWDDDIDIGMPRKDYEFLEKHIQEELGDEYFFQTCITDKAYGRNFAKIRKNNTIFLEKNDANVENRHHGIFLDIFILEERREKDSFIRRFKTKLSKSIDSYIVCKRGNIKISWKKKIFAICPMGLLIKMRKSLNKGKGDFYYIDFMGKLKKSTHEMTELEFEGGMYMAPKGYDEVLTSIYGDYMQLPPPEKRVTHNPVRISFDLNGPDEEL